MASENLEPNESQATRRTILKGAAWAAPVVASFAAAPLAAASLETGDFIIDWTCDLALSDGTEVNNGFTDAYLRYDGEPLTNVEVLVRIEVAGDSRLDPSNLTLFGHGSSGTQIDLEDFDEGYYWGGAFWWYAGAESTGPYSGYITFFRTGITLQDGSTLGLPTPWATVGVLDFTGSVDINYLVTIEGTTRGKSGTCGWSSAQ